MDQASTITCLGLSCRFLVAFPAHRREIRYAVQRLWLAMADGAFDIFLQ